MGFALIILIYAGHNIPSRMKIVLVLAVLVAVAVAEHCATTKDCYSHGVTHCGQGYRVACASNHECDCTHGPTVHKCRTRADCGTQACPNSASATDNHCVD